MDDRIDPVDLHVGARVRARRRMLNVSQSDLAKEVGLTFQEIQKYERGAARILPSRLYRIARALTVSVSYFFEDFESVPGLEPTSGGMMARWLADASRPDRTNPSRLH